MVTDTGIIATSLISLAGMMLFFIINNNNWFKRENFKIQKSSVMAENRIKLKKLEKDLGIKAGKAPTTENSVMDLLKGIDQDKIKNILGYLQGGDDLIDDDEPQNDLEALISKLPPGVIEGFINKLNEGGGEGSTAEGEKTISPKEY